MDERINAPEKANDITSDSAFICHSQVQGRLTSFTGYQPTNENTGDWFEYCSCGDSSDDAPALSLALRAAAVVVGPGAR